MVITYTTSFEMMNTFEDYKNCDKNKFYDNEKFSFNYNSGVFIPFLLFPNNYH